jgi:hypothetical protein
MTSGFNDNEDKYLCDAWLAASRDCINGAQQKGKIHWTKVVLEYNEKKQHKPYKMRNDFMEESTRKRWTYDLQVLRRCRSCCWPPRERQGRDGTGK